MRGIVGTMVGFVLGGIGLALAQTTSMRPDQFVAQSWTWTKAQAVTPAVLTDASSITVNASASNGFTLTLTGNSHTLGNPTGLRAGQTLQFAISTGSGFTGFATASSYKFVGGTAPTWSTAANKKDLLSCWADSASTMLCAASIDVR